MIPSERGIRMRLAAAARRLAGLGLSPATSGNVSARVKAGYIVTPTGAAFESLGPDDFVYMGDDWTHSGGQRPASSEWRLHRDIYRARPEIHAVVHTHSPAATTLACLRRPIPAVHYEVAYAGGKDIPCAAYATFGTQELSDSAVAALRDRRACLLANHGALALGREVEEAALLAERLEHVARLYWQALQAGEPVILDDAEMARIAARFGG